MCFYLLLINILIFVLNLLIKKFHIKVFFRDLNYHYLYFKYLVLITYLCTCTWHLMKVEKLSVWCLKIIFVSCWPFNRLGEMMKNCHIVFVLNISCIWTKIDRVHFFSLSFLWRFYLLKKNLPKKEIYCKKLIQSASIKIASF